MADELRSDGTVMRRTDEELDATITDDDRTDQEKRKCPPGTEVVCRTHVRRPVRRVSLHFPDVAARDLYDSMDFLDLEFPPQEHLGFLAGLAVGRVIVHPTGG